MEITSGLCDSTMGSLALSTLIGLGISVIISSQVILQDGQ
jgi:hypothetical protein